MKKISLKARERIILILCIVLAVVFVGYQFLLKPFLEAGEMIDQKIELQETKLKKNLEIIEGGRGIDGQFEELFKALGEKSSDESELLSAIESTAGQTSVHINNMQPQKAVNKDYYKMFAVNLVMDGRWKDIMKFIYLLENEPYFCYVDQITLEKNSMMADTVRGRMTVGKLRIVR